VARGGCAAATSTSRNEGEVGPRGWAVGTLTFASTGCADDSALSSGRGRCDPKYKGACLDPNASDYDCAGGSGDGPEYTGRVEIVGSDHYGLDADGDGLGCE
jgi:hypothetical protein